MSFCIETQALKAVLSANYLILTCENLPAGAGQGEEDFFKEKTHVCKFGVYHVLHWSLSTIP